jgi:branched-subunit amino acid transport protein
VTLTLLALLALAVGTYALKAIGPVAAAGRELPPVLARAADLLPAALLAALVATETFGGAAGLTLDARAGGLAVAAAAVACKAPFALVVVLGAAATALIRALGFG